MWDSEDSDENGASSFSRLEKNSALNTAAALNTLDSRLFEKQDDAISSSSNIDAESGQSMAMPNQPRRFAANEYDAHTDSLETSEMVDWQCSFPYLRVVGKSNHKHNMVINNDNNSDVTTKSDIEQSIHVSNNAIEKQHLKDLSSKSKVKSLQPNYIDYGGLSIVGNNITVNCVSSAGSNKENFKDDGIEEEKEEIFASHGILIENFIINNEERNKKSVMNLDDKVDPIASQKEEVLSIITDTLWADCVDALKPLVKRICIESSR